ncbi:MAG: GlyGly-CTERM sorting domain-containing protein [Prevotella sp.]|nr:MAG: GlyGly-CTERM sorting domain-containing protein [Prevotella sp.]
MGWLAVIGLFVCCCTRRRGAKMGS